MKSYIKEFNYPTKDGNISKRRLFVMRENAVAMDGLELTYLDEATQKKVLESLKDHEIRSDFLKSDFLKSDAKIDGYESEWGVAWRRYNKEKIVKDKE